MASTVFDSALFRDMFGTAEMRDIFSDEALVGHYLEAEAALARAQASMGVVPKEAAEAIRSRRTSPADRLRQAAARNRDRRLSDPAARPSIIRGRRRRGAVRALGSHHAGYHGHRQRAPDPGGAGHCRARSQGGWQHPGRDGAEISRYADGGAAPIFSRRCPSPLAIRPRSGCPRSTGTSNASNRSRPSRAGRRVSGAAGTLASIGEGGLEMQRLFCEELGLNQPSITWHVARDGIAEAVTLLGLITGRSARSRPM